MYELNELLHKMKIKKITHTVKEFNGLVPTTAFLITGEYNEATFLQIQNDLDNIF